VEDLVCPNPNCKKKLLSHPVAITVIHDECSSCGFKRHRVYHLPGLDDRKMSSASTPVKSVGPSFSSSSGSHNGVLSIKLTEASHSCRPAVEWIACALLGL
jgi:hypothetical protein